MPTFSQQPKLDLRPFSSNAGRGSIGGGTQASTANALKRTIGNQTMQRMFSSGIQTKLRVSVPGDSEEREADRVSEQVTRMPGPSLQRTCSCGGACPACRSESDESLQLKHTQAAEPATTAAPQNVQDALRSPSHPLDSSTRTFMEPRFGYDFSGVRVHAGPLADQSARDLNAHAYTVGNDIVFGAGQWSPGTDDGRRLIAHELTHVVQQSGGSSYFSLSDAAATPARQLIASAPVELATNGERVTTPRLSDEALIARANQIFEEAAKALLAAKNKPASADSLNAMRRQVTVGVLQGYKNGKLVTLVNAHNPKWEPYIKQALQANEVYVEGIAVTPYKVRTDELRTSGHIYVHSEQVLAAEAKSEGLAQPRVATSNNACTQQCMSNLTENYPDVVHVNPNRNYLHEHPEHVIPPASPPPAQPPPMPEKAKPPQGGETPRTGQEGAGGGAEGGTATEGKATEISSEGSSNRSIVEYVGDKVEAVNEGSLNNQALVEGLLVMLQAKEFENQQKAEIEKYEDKLRRETPRIETLRNEGKDVGITLIVERPNAFNLTHDVVPESSDLIRFIDLRVDDNPWWAGVDPAYNARAREEARGGTLKQQLDAQLGSSFPMDSPPRKGWHYVSATKVIPSYKKLATMKGFDGTYRPSKVVGVFLGKAEAARMYGLSRVLHVWHANQYAYTFEMREGTVKAAPPPSTRTSDLPAPQTMGPGSARETARGGSDPDVFQLQLSSMVSLGKQQSDFGGVLIKGTPGQAGSYKLDSQMWHTREKGQDLIIEVVTGEDLDSNWRFGKEPKDWKWGAVIRWEKL